MENIKSVYSPSQNLIYPAGFYSDYIKSGSWPEDGIEISNEDSLKFNPVNQPEGKVLAMRRGKLQWVAPPPLSHEEKLAQFELKQLQLIDTAMQSINVLLTKRILQRPLSEKEMSRLNAVMDYVDNVTAIETGDIDNIAWPEMPE